MSRYFCGRSGGSLILAGILSLIKRDWVGLEFICFGLVIVAGLWTGALAVSGPRATELPIGCDTFGDLSRFTLARRNTQDQELLSDGDVWLILQHLIADTLGRKPDEITKDARWLEDLDAG